MLNHLLANVLEQFSQNESAVRQVSILPVDVVLARCQLISKENIYIRSGSPSMAYYKMLCWLCRSIP